MLMKTTQRHVANSSRQKVTWSYIDACPHDQSLGFNDQPLFSSMLSEWWVACNLAFYWNLKCCVLVPKDLPLRFFFPLWPWVIKVVTLAKMSPKETTSLIWKVFSCLLVPLLHHIYLLSHFSVSQRHAHLLEDRIFYRLCLLFFSFECRNPFFFMMLVLLFVQVEESRCACIVACAGWGAIWKTTCETTRR